jgi:hypothetical protein
MKYRCNILLPSLSVLLLSSCTGLLFGISSPQPASEEEIKQWAFRYDIPDADLYCSKAAKLYYGSLLQTRPEMHHLAKNHLQPLQALYFDKNGNMISWHINCLAGGPMGAIRWNKNRLMNVFPPLTAALPDTNIKFSSFYEMLRPISSYSSFDFYEYDYFVVVYWNDFMKRGSRKLIRTIRRNLSLAEGKRVKVFWVNNDNDFANTDHTLIPADLKWTDSLLRRR